ncbi:MAG TPA: 16S rRNA (cytosine(1402)-N(4))-methyltransferase RsmH, partial [Pyrinomonadaceae bacterium]|nr:16S rRNA (cytosine(1402)-N(4))-methyltransferase RsmH [Pyrinomonadaceae bacterium]
LDSPERGFSFRHDAPLDMRMDMTGGETAAELLGRLSEVELARIIFEYGEERRARRIARWVIKRRESGDPIRTTRDLAELVQRAIGPERQRRIHPATRTFQALRIAVNGELENLDIFLVQAVGHLEPDGRLAVISFHSLEDRIVKRTLAKLSGRCQCPPRLPKCICGAAKSIEILTKRPITPTAAEIEENPRARSARLRVARKI